MKKTARIFEAESGLHWRFALAVTAVVAMMLGKAHAQEQAAKKRCYYANIQTLPIHFNGFRPTIEGSINGKSVTMLVDSGAFSTSLFQHAAERLGSTLGHSSLGGLGVGGETEHYRVFAKEIKIGPSKGTNQVVPVIRSYSAGIKVDGLAGADFLFQRDLEISLIDHYLKFYNSHGCEDAYLSYWDENASMVPFKTGSETDRTPEIDVIVNGKKLRATIDSGASSSIIDLRAAASLGITPQSANVVKRKFSASGIGEHEMEVWIAPFDEISIGDETVRNARIEIADLWGNVERDVQKTYIGRWIDEQPQMILGVDFLRAHRVLFSVMQNRMYFSYLGGNVFRTSDKDDFTWYKTAAERGDQDAQYNLGLLYLYSADVPRDADMARSLFMKAAVQGNGQAQNALGNLYENGDGVPMDTAQAIEWYRKSAQGGYVYGQLNLARMYEHGIKVEKDEIQAGNWYRKAADQDAPIAQAKMAAFYLRGKGVSRDDAIAHEWMSKLTKDDRPDQYWYLGRELFEQGMYKESVFALQKIIEKKPEYQYSAIWLYLARARGEETDGLDKELESNRTKWKEGKWQATIADFFAGRITADQFMKLAHDPDEKTDKGQTCEANFYSAQRHLIKHETEKAQPLLQAAANDCPKSFVEYDAAIAELEQLEAR